MTEKQILESIKAKKYQPVYFLCGEESYYLDKIMSAFEHEVLEESEKAFNQSVFYGRDITFKNIVDACRQFPMMSPLRIVLIKEAQDMRDFASLETYFKNPSPQTILVICHKHKKVDGRKSVYKLLKKEAVFFESKKVPDYKLAKWIKNYSVEQGFRIGEQAAALMAEYLGNDLKKVVNEFTKATLDLPKGSEIDTDLIQDKIGVSKEYNVFELQKALGSRNTTKAFQIADNMAQNIKTNPVQMIISFLYTFFTQVFIAVQNKQLSDGALAEKLRVNPYFVKDYKLASSKFSPKQLNSIFQTLKIYDLKSKGLGMRNSAHDGDILRELIMKIIYH